MSFVHDTGRRAAVCVAGALALTLGPAGIAQARPAAAPAGHGASAAAGKHHRTPPADAVQARARARLRSFVRWLDRGHARGYIGEVGWPGNASAGGDPRWNALARDWYAQARAARLWVTAWAAGDFWQPSYKLLVYSTSGWPSLSPNPQASVVEDQAGPDLRGVNVAGAEFGDTPVDEATSAFSNVRRGRVGVDYTFPEPASLAYLARRGVTLVRLPLRWERLQPRLAGPLDAGYLAGVRETLAAAHRAGMRVIVDLHNYGAYYVDEGGQGVRRAIGSRQLPDADFADVWRRTARALGRQPALVGYGLMNEPVGMRDARAWERASRAAARAIRRTGDRHRIFVAGYDWSSVDGFARNHPRGPWIRGARIVYEAHQYFDDDNSGRYARSYGAELARARHEGYRGVRSRRP